VRQLPWFLWLVVAAIVAAATARWPYGYYTFVRIVVCGFCGYLTYLALTEKAYMWGAALGLTAILFNPIIPIHLTRSTWFWLNITAAAIILAHLAFVRLRTA
jgi:hypothetical protein